MKREVIRYVPSKLAIRQKKTDNISCIVSGKSLYVSVNDKKFADKKTCHPRYPGSQDVISGTY